MGFRNFNDFNLNDAGQQRAAEALAELESTISHLENAAQSLRYATDGAAIDEALSSLRGEGRTVSSVEEDLRDLLYDEDYREADTIYCVTCGSEEVEEEGDECDECRAVYCAGCGMVEVEEEGEYCPACEEATRKLEAAQVAAETANYSHVNS